MLYELLTGERPYRLKRFSRGALEEAILQVDPVPPGRVPLTDAAADARATTPKKLARLLRGELDNITFKTLRKLPAERYATANAFAEDIGRFLRGEPVLAQRHGVVSRGEVCAPPSDCDWRFRNLAFDPRRRPRSHFARGKSGRDAEGCGR
jgi:serine/threonine-protein kinase